MNESVKVVFGLAGGLALFLYGMNAMSDALQKAAGEKMKQILGFLTSNPIMGALAGALVTAILQSSSATTVMVIGFVSAGLMTLPQAISVIFGANIGTTMTAQLLAFKISDYIYPIIFVGFMVTFLAKKERIRNIGMVIFSFGLLFEGIEIMGSVMKPLASSQVFIDLMAKVKDIPILGVALGMCMTLVVQSSSATIAVLQNFAQQPGPDGVSSVIGLTGAIPILLGDNIGTTITAILASLTQSKNAKRTAIAHSFFNISGTIVFLFIIPWFAKFVAFISPKGNELDIISRQIANAHTTFNLVCTLIWLPLIPLMVKLVKFVIPGDDTVKKIRFAPKYLDDGLLEQPIAAMYLASREIKHVAKLSLHMLSAAKRELTPGQSTYPFGTFDDLHEEVKNVEEAIITYMTRLFTGGGLTEMQSEKLSGLMSVMNNIGRIADRCEDITGALRQMSTDGKAFSMSAVSELAQCFDIAEIEFSRAMDSIETGNMIEAQQVSKDKKKMRKAQKQFRKAHIARVEAQECDPNLSEDFTSILFSLERITDNCVAIAEETMDNVSYVTIRDTGVSEALPASN
jgi:phosphate:Na+ symporter